MRWPDSLTCHGVHEDEVAEPVPCDGAEVEPSKGAQVHPHHKHEGDPCDPMGRLRLTHGADCVADGC